VLSYLHGSASDPFHDIYSSPGWLTGYDPPRPFPFFVNLEPTNHCQLNCLFCSRQLSERPKGCLDLGLAARIFDETAGHPGTAVRLAGWGEPLLHPEIVKIVSMAKGRGIRLKIYTNGLALTEETMARFVDLGLDDLQFSMQGLNEKQYLFNRVGSDYKKLVANIEMAARVRERLGGAGGPGGGARPFLSILTSVLADELREDSPGDFVGRWLGTVDKVAVDLTNLNFVSRLPRVAPHLRKQSGDLRRGLCVDVFLAVEVKYDGTVQFCGQDSRGLPEHTAGRLPGESLRDIWLGGRFNDQRDRVGRSLGHENSPVCRDCHHNTSKYDVFKQAPSAGGPPGDGGA
jgi:hypothetical protein